MSLVGAAGSAGAVEASSIVLMLVAVGVAMGAVVPVGAAVQAPNRRHANGKIDFVKCVL